MGEGLVFDRKARSDMSRAGRAEPIWRSLERSGRQRAGRVRDLLNAWAESVPRPARGGLIPRLRSEDNYEFLGAFWELYLGEVLRRCGYGPEFHPAIGGSSRRPDFRAVAAEPFLLEGTLASPSTAERAAARRVDSLYDLLDRTPSGAFFIDIEIKAVGSRAPSAKALRKEVDGWLAAIDPDSLIATGLSLKVLDSHALRWRWEDWEVVLRPLPKSPGSRGAPSDPLVGMSSRGLGLVDTRSALRRALREKASAYGDPGLPFIIAVLALDPLIDEGDVRQVLFGTEGIGLSIAAGRVRGRKLVRRGDGFWYGSRPSHTRVSAAVVGLNVAPWMAARVWPSTWQNPWAKNSLRTSLPFPVVERDPSRGGLVTHPATQDPWQFFELDPRWPD